MTCLPTHQGTHCYQVYSLHNSCELLLFIKHSHERTHRTNAMHKALFVDMNTAVLAMTAYSHQISISFIFFL